jgi:hypothetical protein
MSLTWLNKWASFAGFSLKDRSIHAQSSTVPPPVPIDNSDLQGSQDSNAIRAQATEGKDYLRVPLEAAQKLYEWYCNGEDPQFQHKKIEEGQSIFVQLHPRRAQLTQPCVLFCSVLSVRDLLQVNLYACDASNGRAPDIKDLQPKETVRLPYAHNYLELINQISNIYSVRVSSLMRCSVCTCISFKQLRSLVASLCLL